MSSDLATDDRTTKDSDSNSEENDKVSENSTPKKKAPLEGLKSNSNSVDRRDTSFNPFGKFKNVIETHKTDVEESVNKVIKSFTAENAQSPALFLKRCPETTKLTIELKKLSGTVRFMAKKQPSAVPCTLSSFATMFVELCSTFNKNLNNVRSGDIMLISQNVADVITMIAQYLPEPFTSELLESWNSLFETLLSSKVTILRKSGIDLWKASFGKVKGTLKYPEGKLRKLLVSLQTKYKITIPENESSSPAKSIVFSEDEDEVAMDGIEVGSEKTGPTEFAVPAAKETSFQDSSTFELSQQPQFDKLAHQLVVEKEEEAKVEVKKRGRPRKSSVLEKALLDEDSVDFVVIKTPTSNRKAKLTDRQKEMFQESRDGLNYVDEASQSGSQRESAIKNALITLNFDVGSDSVSASDVKVAPTAVESDKNPSVEKKEQKSVEKEEKIEQKKPRQSLKRTRRLFGSDPDLSLTEKPQKSAKTEEKADVNLDETKDNLNKSKDDTLIMLPGMDEIKITDKLNISEDHNVFAPVLNEKEKEVTDYGDLKEEKEGVVEKVSRSQSKKQSNPTKIVKKVLPTRQTRRRSAVALRFDDKEEKVDSDEEQQTKKQIIEEVIEEKTVVEDIEMAEEEQKEKEEHEEEMEVPHTPANRKVAKMVTTPSILRKTPVAGTPLTERKRNRVHFDADSLSSGSDKIVKKSSSVSPVNSHPIQTVDDSKSINDTSVKTEDTVVLEAFAPIGGFDPESVILYPAMKHCEDSIEKLVRKLIPLSGAVSALSILRKSFSNAGIRTVGQFSGMTVQQVSKLNGIRPVREKTAKKVLADYEAKKRLISAAKEDEDKEKNGQSSRSGSESPESDSAIKVAAENEVKEEKVEDKKVETTVKKVSPEKEEKKTVVVEESKENVEKENVENVQKSEDATILPIVTATSSSTASSSLPEAMVESPEKIGEELEKLGCEDMEEETAAKNKTKNVEKASTSCENEKVVVETPKLESSSSFTTPKASGSEVLGGAMELDKISRQLARNVDRNEMSLDELEKIDDLLFDTIIRLKGLKELVREKGLKKQ